MAKNGELCMKEFFSKVVKKHCQTSKYIILTLITLIYVRIIMSSYYIIREAKEDGLFKLFEEKIPVWFYASADKLILHEQIVIYCLVVAFCLAGFFIRKRYIISIFILFLPIIFLLFEVLYVRYAS